MPDRRAANSSDVLAHHPASLRRQSGSPFRSCCLPLAPALQLPPPCLNLQVDAKRRLTTEFRAFGPNVLIIPKGALRGQIPRLCPSPPIHFGARESPQCRVTVRPRSHGRQRFSFHSRGSLSPLLSPGPIRWRFLESQCSLLQPPKPISMGQPIDGTSVRAGARVANSWASAEHGTRLSQR